MNWTQAEVKKLKELWDIGMTVEHMALRIPNRTPVAIRGKLQRMGIGYHGFSTIRKSKVIRDKVYDVLMEYDGLTTGQIAAKVGCTENSALYHCKKLKGCVPVNWSCGRAMYGFGKRMQKPKPLTKAEVMRKQHAKKRLLNNFWRIAA